VPATTINSSLTSTIDILNSNGTSLSSFTSLPARVNAYGLGFAPESFGAYGADLFVTDSSSGKLYVIDAAGDAALFATLPLPTGFTDSGLRYIAWAPAGFAIPEAGGAEDLGGDLFVSIAAQNGGGGTDGEIDVLNAAGDTVAHYLVGSGATPLEPRGLFFANDTTLLVANADPSIQLLTPSDFVPGSPVPEASTWVMMVLGFAGLGYAGRRARRKTTAAAA
jgi:PEP-CTERM motif